MQVFFYIAFIVIICIAAFAVQNSSAPPVMIKFLLWKFETSLVYAILGSISLGILLTLLFWIPKAIPDLLSQGEITFNLRDVLTLSLPSDG